MFNNEPLELKKYLLQFIILFYISCIGNAQEYFHFPDSNAIWTQVYYPEYNGTPVTYCFGILNDDTVINSVKYHKLYNSADTIFQESEVCGGIREDTILKRVYYSGNLTDGKEVILYDFSVEEGDTLIDDSVNIYYMLDAEGLIVEKIDSVIIDDSYRKEIYFKYYDNVFNWIEGIGNTRGLLTPSQEFPNNGYWHDLVCCKQNDKWLYHNTDYPDCFPIFVGITDTKTNETKIQVYPNPVTDLSYFKLENTEHLFQTLEIFNSSGEKLYTYIIEKQSDIIIYRSDFSSGLYFYRCIETNGNKITGKFIVK